MGTTKGTTGSRGKKHASDKFYTKPSVACALIDSIDLTGYDVIIEPSAGSGVFSSQISGCLAYDIEPEGKDIIQGDWLSLDKSIFTGKKSLVIGNPPFGSNGHLAMKFINESAVFADTIAFILPRGFVKESVQRRVNLYFHLEKQIELTEPFELNGEDYHVPCVFQVWARKDEPRVTREITRGHRISDIIEFVKNPDDGDFRIQRVGGNAGKASFDLSKSPSSNYFVKNISEIPNDTLVALINTLTFPSIDHTTGPRSLPKSELIEVLDRAVNERTA